MSDTANIIDVKGKKTVDIKIIKFSGKRKIDWEESFSWQNGY